MRFVSFVCLIAVAQFVVAADDNAEARKKLVGTWKGGVEDGAQGHVLTITPDLVSCITIKGDKESKIGGGTVKLDLSKKPWRMDATGTQGGQKGRSWFGIYSLEGDTLKYCVNSKQAPTEFNTGDGNFCLVLKRQEADDNAEARKKLVGTWKGGVEDGAQGHVLTITPDLVSCITIKGDKESKIGGGTVKLDLSKKPWRMDATGTQGGQKGRSWFGIYSLEGDTLKYCVNSKQAPTEFNTGDGNFCLVLKRQDEKSKTSASPTKPARVAKSSKQTVAELQESAPAELSAKVLKTLGPSGLRIGSGGKVVCDIWLRVDVPVLKESRKRTDRNYPIESGTLMGAIRFPKKDAGDFRDLKIAPGVYTMRYALQPKDDIHESTALFRDFSLLLSAADDTDPARISDEDDLSQRSIEAGGGFHPAMLYLKPPAEGRKKLPAMFQSPGTDANTNLEVLAAKTAAKGNSNIKEIQIELVTAGYAKE